MKYKLKKYKQYSNEWTWILVNGDNAKVVTLLDPIINWIIKNEEYDVDENLFLTISDKEFTGFDLSYSFQNFEKFKDLIAVYKCKDDVDKVIKFIWDKGALKNLFKVFPKEFFIGIRSE